MQSYIEALALAIGIPMAAIHHWRRQGRVAARHWLPLVEAAQARHGQVLSAADMMGFEKLRPGRRKNVQLKSPAACAAEAAEQVVSARKSTRPDRMSSHAK